MKNIIIKKVTNLSFFLTTGILLFSGNSQAQVGTIAQIESPRSPDAAALGKYVEMPIGSYSGLPDISIPLFEIKQKEMSIPLSISYHASGIKVKELPGSLGAGWSLNSGGMITRIVRGHPDDHNEGESDLENENIRRRLKAAEERGFDNEFNFVERFNITASVPGVEKEGEQPHMSIDTEYDTFYFNFAGNTGEFTFNNEGKPMLLSGNNLKIEYSNRKFKITDANGIIYSFDAIEQDMDTRYGHNDYGLSYTTSWFLTKVYSPITKSEINLTYKRLSNAVLYDDTENWRGLFMSNGIRVKLSDETTFILRRPPLPVNEDCLNVTFFTSGSSLPSRYGNGVVLDEINWDQHRIKFYGNTNRMDIYKYKIDSIKVTSGSELIKDIKFQYGYFNANETLREFKKLKLEQLTINAEKHSFDYIESKGIYTLPELSNTSVDHWGYFNASGGSGYPDYKIYDSEFAKNENILRMANGYKNPNASYAEIGTLRSITFPTGGKAIYSYEGNEFQYAPFALPNIALDPYNQLKFQSHETHSNSISFPNMGHKSSNFRIPDNQSVKLTASLGLIRMSYDEYYQNVLTGFYGDGPNYATLTIRKIGGGGVDLYYRIDPKDLMGDPGSESEFEVVQDVERKGVINIKTDVFLEAGEYEISCSTYGYGLFSFAQVEATNSYMNDTDTYKAGGLRIKKIEYLGGSGVEKSFEKSYLYENEDGKSSGVLESPFANVSRSYYFGVFKDLDNYAKTSKCSFYDIYPNPIIPLGNSKGGIIGYSRVTEKLSDNSRIVRYFTNGAEQYVVNGKYTSSQDIFLENEILGTRTRVLEDNSWKRGVEHRTDYFDGSNSKVKSDFKSFDFVEDKSRKSVSLTLEDINFEVDGTPRSRKIYIKRYKRDVLLLQDSTINYYPTGNIVTVNKYDYNTSKHPYVGKITNLSSSGIKTVTNLRYPQDFDPGISPADDIARGIHVLLSNNVVAPVIEKTIQKSDHSGNNFRTVASGLNVFNKTSPLPQVTYTLEANTPLTNFSPLVLANGNTVIDSRYHEKIVFSKYDNYGNPLEVKEGNLPSTVYLWGYGGQYLVAKIENATYAQVTAALGSGASVLIEALNVPTVSDNTINSTVETIRQNLSNAQVSTYTHKPLVGVTSMTDPHGIKTEYKYDGLQRLKDVVDFEGNVLKNYRYHYRP